MILNNLTKQATFLYKFVETSIFSYFIESQLMPTPEQTYYFLFFDKFVNYF